MGNAVGREVVTVDSYDYSSQYGDRRRGRRHVGGYSTGSEYDTTGTWGGNTTQYSQSEARNQSECPSSGESERKDRYHPFENNDADNYNSDSDSVTEMTDMGHHGTGRERRREADRYRNQEAESDEESSSMERDERDETPSETSDDYEDRDDEFEDDVDPRLRKAFSEPLDPYLTPKRFARQNQRGISRKHEFARISPPRKSHREARKGGSNVKPKRSYYKGMDLVHLQQVDEEAYELYADLETKGTLSPQNSLQVLVSKSRSRSKSPPISPASKSDCISSNAQQLVASRVVPPPTPEKSIDPTNSASVLVEAQSQGGSSAASRTPSGPSEDYDEKIYGSSEEAASPKIISLISYDEQVGEVALKNTLSGQSLEMIAMPAAFKEGGLFVELNESQSIGKSTTLLESASKQDVQTRFSDPGASLVDQGNQLAMGTLQFHDDGVVAGGQSPGVHMHSTPQSNAETRVLNNGKGEDVAAACTANTQDPHQSTERDQTVEKTSLEASRLSPFQRSLLKREFAPTPETGPRAPSAGPLFQSQYHYVQDGSYRDMSSSYSRRNSKSASFERSRSVSPGAKVVADDNQLGEKMPAKRGPSPEIPETHTLALLQHNTNSFETGVTNTESRLAGVRQGKSDDGGVLASTSRTNIEINHSASHTNCDSLVAQGSYRELMTVSPAASPTKQYRDSEDLRVVVDDQSVEASKLHLPEEKMARSILNERIRKALANGTSPTYGENFHFDHVDKVSTQPIHLDNSPSLVSAVGSRTAGGTTYATVSEVLSDIEDVDLYFVQQYEMAFDVFMQQNIKLMAKNPELVYNLRVAKLQQMLQVTADVETSLREQIVMKHEEKRQMLETYKKQLVEAARRKAALETHLRHQLNIIQQATAVMKGKITWQTIESNNKRAKRHYEILQRLSREKQSPMVLLYRLPKETVSTGLRDVVTAPSSSTFSEKQERELQQLQVDTTFLKAEVKVLEKALSAEQTKAKKYAWVDSLLIRMDPTHFQRLKRRYQKKLGATL